MWSIFNRPYPFNDDLKQNSKIIFFTSIGIFAFLFLFQPFDIGTLPVKMKYYLITGVAFMTFISLSINMLVIPSLFPKIFNTALWNIKKEILWYTWILFTTLVGYFFVNKFLVALKVEFSTVIKLILTAVVPLSIIIIINYNNILRTHLKLADEITRKLNDNKIVHEKIVYINSDYQKDSLAVKVSLLILVRSADNYVEVFWNENGEIKNQLVRCSLTYVEELLKDFKVIFKCHRSYLINVNYIQKIEGNSQGYRLFFDNISFFIPVSKNSIEKLKEIIEILH
jgi:hypothetical protein